MKIAINGEILEVSGGVGLPEGTVAVKPVTKAEYDALTDEEKQADVAYAITDDAGSSSSAGSSEEIYSTEETRIGTWIDGKPLYRRVCTFTTDSSADNVIMEDFDFSEIDNLVSGKGAMRVGTTSGYVLPAIIGSSGVSFTFDIYGGKIRYSNNSPVYKNKPTTLIFEYTKTTDTGGTT